MFKKSIICLVLLLVAANSAYAEVWNFAVFGDTRDSSGSAGSGVNAASLTAIATDISNNRNCEFVLLVGDNVRGEYGTSPPLLDDQFQTFKDSLAVGGLKLIGTSGSGVPYYLVRGNHDVVNTAYGTDVDASWRSNFDTLPQNGPTTGGGGNSEVGMTYSFTYNNALILALDEYANTLHTVNQDWIDQQLAGNSLQHTFAFGHEPSYQAAHPDCLAANQSARVAFLTSLYNAGGRIYFCGHDHFSAIARVYEKDPASGGTQGFYQVIVGGGGAPAANFYGDYSSAYPTDYEVAGFYYDSNPALPIPFHYAYAVVTIDDDLLWLRLYGTESLTTIDWQLLYALVISGTLQTDADTMTSDFANDATVVFNQSSDATYSGIIKGTGALVKNGAGALTLSANNDYTGATTVNAGTLKITGESFRTSVTVNPGGILTGDGIIKSLTNYGIVGPGNPVGILHLDGNVFNQGSSGTLEIDVQSTSSYDQIVAITTANLEGTLKTITTGSYSIGDTLSEVINDWVDVTINFSFLDTQITPTIIWKPEKNENHHMDLVATRDYNNDVLKASLTPNQRNIAALAQALFPSATGDLATVKSAINSLSTNAEVADAYSQISGEKFNGLSSLAFTNTVTQLNSLQGQMQTLRTGVGRGMAFNRNSGTFRGDLFNSVLLAYEGEDWVKFVPRSDAKAREQGSLGLFVNTEGNFGDQESTDSQPGFHFSAGGLTGGLDYRLRENLIAGFDLGYTRTVSHLGGSGGEADVDSLSCGIYGTYFGNNYYLNAAGSYSYNFYDLERNLIFGGLDRKAKADTDGRQWDLFLGTGYDFHLRQLTTGPTASLKYSKLRIDGFTETGADALNLSISKQEAESLQSGLGWRVEYEFKFGKNTLLVPQAHVSYQHEFLNDSRSIEARLAQGGDVFQVTTDKPSRNFALVGLGLAAKLGGSASLNFGYEAQVGQNNYIAHSIEGGISLYF